MAPEGEREDTPDGGRMLVCDVLLQGDGEEEAFETNARREKN